DHDGGGLADQVQGHDHHVADGQADGRAGSKGGSVHGGSERMESGGYDKPHRVSGVPIPARRCVHHGEPPMPFTSVAPAPAPAAGPPAGTTWGGAAPRAARAISNASRSRLADSSHAASSRCLALR